MVSWLIALFSSALYLSAFESPLRNAFRTEELLQLAHEIQQKDLRFFTNLSAFIKPDTDEEDLSVEDDDEDHSSPEPQQEPR
jgi:hypothetical protein